ncbi:hypothetical protein Z948_914 [Sulfitobacter donghicola DSW-25 = KCTC 12864 = JCM 14565]|nr:hypothetical protein Z948_914 [Sulfitobacter donghicola DSW-25 = KCTC 12864 = JCM 14565]
MYQMGVNLIHATASSNLNKPYCGFEGQALPDARVSVGAPRPKGQILLAQSFRVS